MGTPERIPDDERKRGEGRKRRNKDGSRETYFSEKIDEWKFISQFVTARLHGRCYTSVIMCHKEKKCVKKKVEGKEEKEEEGERTDN